MTTERGVFCAAQWCGRVEPGTVSMRDIESARQDHRRNWKRDRAILPTGRVETCASAKHPSTTGATTPLSVAISRIRPSSRVELQKD